MNKHTPTQGATIYLFYKKTPKNTSATHPLADVDNHVSLFKRGGFSADFGEECAGSGFLSCQPVSPESTQLQRRHETEIRSERENLNLLKEEWGTDQMLERDYQRSRERLAGLRSEYKALREALEPKAIRVNWERASIPSRSVVSSSGKLMSNTDIIKPDIQYSDRSE